MSFTKKILDKHTLSTRNNLNRQRERTIRIKKNKMMDKIFTFYTNEFDEKNIRLTQVTAERLSLMFKVIPFDFNSILVC